MVDLPEGRMFCPKARCFARRPVVFDAVIDGISLFTLSSFFSFLLSIFIKKETMVDFARRPSGFARGPK